jgi:hypothetical protein
MTPLFRTLFAAFVLLVAACATPDAQAQAQPQSSWTGVERIVVIGDLHGDYAKFADQLRQAGLTNESGDWIGGRTHLVQLGDVPDRAPNTRQILDELRRLEPQARRAGGYVHALIGNHEAMNMEGDLRYTTPGEFAAFADRNSPRLRAQYYANTVAYLRAHPPASGLPAFDDAFRAQWEAAHPLGYVEHQRAWSPTGIYGRWVSGHDAIIRINDILFVHGGLGPGFSTVNRDTMNDAVRAALHGNPVAEYQDILTNQNGPLWYRGLALNPDSGEQANLDSLLGAQGVSRVIVGHTKRASTVLPRFNGHVVLTDIAVPSGFADPHAFLIIENGAMTTVYRGQRVPLQADTPAQTCAYLAQIAAIDNGAGPNATLASRCATDANVAADAAAAQ